MSTRDSAPRTVDYLRLIFRQTPGVVWATDRALRFTYAQGRTLALGDVEPKQLVGQTVYDFVGTTDPSEPAVAHHLAALAGAHQSFEYFRSGRAFDVQIDPLVDGGGTVIGCVGTAVDVTDLRRARERLEHSEARLAEAQRVAHIGSFEWDVLTDRVTWSEELQQIHGAIAGEPAGTLDEFLARIHPDDQARVRATIVGVCCHPAPFTYDYRILRPDRQVRTLHAAGEVIADGPGAPVRVVGSCWDITQQHDTTQKLQQSVSLMHATLDATADGVLVIDRSGSVAASNQRFAALWGIPQPLLDRRDDDALMHYASAQLENPLGFLDSVRELKASTRESFDVLRFKDGRVFECASIPQRVHEQVVGRVWSFHDVTERERLLRRAEFLGDATRLLSSLEVNRALESVARLSVPFMAERCAIDLIEDGAPRRLTVAGDARSKHTPEFHAAVLNGHSTIYRANGRSHLGVPLIGRESITGVLTFMAPRERVYSGTDLELADDLGRRMALSIDNARLYEAARTAVDSRDEFLAIVAHEIRGPLTSTHLAAQGLLRGTFPPAAAHRALETIQREDRRLARFVDDLLDLGRIRTGQFHFELEEVDLGAVVRDVVSRHADALTQRGSAVTIETHGDLVGEWDRFRLEQVITNLLSNAIKYGDGKPIDLAAGRNGDTVLVTVTDRGIGIPQDMLTRIFDPYQRAVDVRHFGGLGLGLHIAKTIVEGLGGTMSVNSQQDAGTTFLVELPVSRSVS